MRSLLFEGILRLFNIGDWRSDKSLIYLPSTKEASPITRGQRGHMHCQSTYSAEIGESANPFVKLGCHQHQRYHTSFESDKRLTTILEVQPHGISLIPKVYDESKDRNSWVDLYGLPIEHK